MSTNWGLRRYERYSGSKRPVKLLKQSRQLATRFASAGESPPALPPDSGEDEEDSGKDSREAQGEGDVGGGARILSRRKSDGQKKQTEECKLRGAPCADDTKVAFPPSV